MPGPDTMSVDRPSGLIGQPGVPATASPYLPRFDVSGADLKIVSPVPVNRAAR